MLIILFESHIFLYFQKLCPSKSMCITVVIDSEEFLNIRLNLSLILLLSQSLLQLILNLVHIQILRLIFVQQVKRTVGPLLQDSLSLQQHFQLVHTQVSNERSIRVHFVQPRCFTAGHDGLRDRNANQAPDNDANGVTPDRSWRHLAHVLDNQPDEGSHKRTQQVGIRVALTRHDIGIIWSRQVLEPLVQETGAEEQPCVVDEAERHVTT